ncbi:hypothetical protein K8353_05575 [Burkholderia contaminans]|nr:hypothetical protein [Burkholderia contaminans]
MLANREMGELDSFAWASFLHEQDARVDVAATTAHVAEDDRVTRITLVKIFGRCVVVFSQ